MIFSKEIHTEIDSVNPLSSDPNKHVYCIKDWRTDPIVYIRNKTKAGVLIGKVQCNNSTAKKLGGGKWWGSFAKGNNNSNSVPPKRLSRDSDISRLPKGFQSCLDQVMDLCEFTDDDKTLAIAIIKKVASPHLFE